MSAVKKIERAPAFPADFSEQLARARKSLEASREAREAARLARKAARGAAASETTPEQAKAARKEAAERSRSMTKVLVPLARIGARDGIERAVAQGARMDLAYDKGVNPAMAALLGGHSDLALWIMGEPGYVWLDKRYPRTAYTELSAAVSADDLRAFQAILALRQDLAAFSKGSPYGYRNVELIDSALESAPDCAAWMIGHRPDLARPKRPRGAEPLPGYRACGALLRALREGKPAQASILLHHMGPEMEAGPKFCMEVVGRVLLEDDPVALAWILDASKIVAQRLHGGFASQLNPQHVGHRMTHGGASAQALAKRFFCADENMPSRNKRPLASLPSWAAGVGAADCLAMLLSMPAMRERLALMQSEPDKWLWEEPMAHVDDPAIVSAMDEAGYDWSMRSEGWGYAGLLMSFKRPTVKWLEMMGKGRSELLGARTPEGQAPFELARQRHGEMAEKWNAVADKAATRGGARASRATKEVKARSKPRRL